MKTGFCVKTWLYSCSPITIDDYCSAVANAVELALADLHYKIGC